MADDLKYGYKGAEPTQSFGNNTGVFDPNDINNLIADNKWTTFGQLELIETQSSTSLTTTVNFESIQESKYNVHLLTFSEGAAPGYQWLSLRFGNDGTYTTSGYQYAAQRYRSDASFGEEKSTSTDMIRIAPYLYQGENAYAYIYNIGDSSKYSFATYHSMVERISGGSYATSTGTKFGSGVLPQTSTVDEIKLFTTTDNIAKLTASLYGIAES